MWIDYFKEPVQVTLREVCEGEFVEFSAIAYKDEFILGDTGDVIKITDFFNEVLDTIQECRDMYDATGNVDWLTIIPRQFITVHYDHWKNLNNTITNR